MTIDTAGIFAAVASHAQSTGLFETVLTHEPKSAPGPGVTVGIWFAGLRPVAAASGLAVTSAVLTLTVRIYRHAITEPQDLIDPEISSAAETLMAAYSGDFTLGDRVRNVDLLGAFGESLIARPGYLPIGETTFRTVDITLPLVISDAWTQAP